MGRGERMKKSDELFLEVLQIETMLEGFDLGKNEKKRMGEEGMEGRRNWGEGG
jgi:hypothetical protein